MKVAILTARLGSFDKPQDHVSQDMEVDFFEFNDENFPLRTKAITHRLQAKIPKFFGWQLKPHYDYYIWLDGNIRLKRPDSARFLLESCLRHDFAVIRHPRRPNIRQEARYLRKGLREQSIYLTGRYDLEWTPEQVLEINSDRNYVDDLMVLGGVFIYKNSKGARQTLKEWWYFVSRYSVFDQLAFPYVLKTYAPKFKILDIIDGNSQSDYLELNGHRYHGK